MNIVNKIIFKLRIELRFLLEQKWGVKKPADRFTISKSILKKFLPVNPVIIDCGAHIGSDSVELARVFPKSTIYAFEPVPELYQKLVNNCKGYPNISCFQLALSNYTGQMEMFVSSGHSDASSSLLQPTGHLDAHPDVHFAKKINVKTFTIDDWARANNVSKIDFLWLDMQGFELQTLKGSPSILKTVQCIHTEVSLMETYKDAVLYSDYKQWLELQGFKEELIAIPEGADMGNAVFTKHS